MTCQSTVVSSDENNNKPLRSTDYLLTLSHIFALLTWPLSLIDIDYEQMIILIRPQNIQIASFRACHCLMTSIIISQLALSKEPIAQIIF